MHRIVKKKIGKLFIKKKLEMYHKLHRKYKNECHNNIVFGYTLKPF